MAVPHFIYPFIRQWTFLGCCHFLAAVDKAALYMGVETPLWDPCFYSFVYIPRVPMLELVVIPFLIFWWISATFRSGYTILQSHEGCTRFPFPLHLHQHLSLLVILMMDILTGVRWGLIVVLMCVSLMISDFEHLFTCFWAFVYLLWRNV